MPQHEASHQAAADLLGATLACIARIEAAGLKPPRLTDPDHRRWTRFRRRLGWADYVSLLHDDLAGAFPVPFDLSAWPAPPRALADRDAELLVRRHQTATSAPPAEFLRDQARTLGLFAGGALSDLPRVQPQDRVLELPGSGGRIAAHLALTDDSFSLHDQVTFVAGTPAERVAIGLAVVELRANRPTIWGPDQAERELAAGARFDRAFGFRGAAPAVEWAARIEGARLV